MPITKTAYKLLFPLRGPIPDEETYGINKMKANGRGEQSRAAVAVPMNDEREDMEPARGGNTARNVGAGIGLAGAAAVAGLSKSGQKKVASVENKSAKKIAAIDKKAMQDVSAVYREKGINMQYRGAQDIKVGVMTIPLAVIGASTAAFDTDMDASNRGRVQAIEVAANKEIRSIGRTAGDEIEAIHEKEGLPFGTSASPSANTRSAPLAPSVPVTEATTSRNAIGGAALGAAAVAAIGVGGVAIATGLSKSGQKKTAAVQKKSAKKIAAVDSKAMKDISAVYREKSIDMRDAEPKETTVGVMTVPIAVMGASVAASRTEMDPADVGRIAAIEVAAKEEIKSIDQNVGDEIEAIHQKEGLPFETSASPSATRSALSAPSVAATSRSAIGGAALGAAAVAAIGIGGVAIAAGLSKSGQKKTASVQKKSAKKITEVDNKAMKDISAVYSEKGIEMKESNPKETKVGNMTVPVAVIGASSVAINTDLDANDVGRIAAIEVAAKDEIKSIDQKAGDEIEELHEKEGLPFAKASSPIATRSANALTGAPASKNVGGVTVAGAAVAGVAVVGVAGAAVAAGLSKSGQKKAEAVEKKSVKKIAAIDKKAVKDISVIYRKNSMEMEQPEAKETQVGSLSVPLAFIGASSAASKANMVPEGVARVEQIENDAKAQIRDIDAQAGNDVDAICEKEGISADREIAMPVTSAGRGGGKVAAAAVGAAAVGAAGLVALGGLKKSSQKQVTAVQDTAAENIATVDNKAMTDISSIYRENGLQMERPEPTSTKVGVMTATLGVVGVGALARKTNMGSLDLGRIGKVERDATEEIERIDEKAGDEITAIHEKEGKWFARPGASRAAGVAAAAGLGLKSVKKIASIEDKASSQITTIDEKAAEGIREADKKHAIHMHKCAKKSMTLEFWDGEEKAAVTKYEMIGEKASDKIAMIDEKAEDNIEAVYRENGKTMDEKSLEGNYFTARGATGATAAAAAIAAAAKMAMHRRENLSNKSRSTATRSTATNATSEDGVMGMAHLALYDFGATVAAAGKAVTGADLEGPVEYDARSHWTPEQRASRSCCA